MTRDCNFGTHAGLDLGLHLGAHRRPEALEQDADDRAGKAERALARQPHRLRRVPLEVVVDEHTVLAQALQIELAGACERKTGANEPC